VVIFKGFDPTNDPAYLATHTYHSGIFQLESQYMQEHGDPRFAYGCTVEQDPLNERVGSSKHTRLPAVEEDLAIEHRKGFFDS
jgi:hypothetical protein